jgi:AcrR family transcriptional regulator
MTESRPVYQSAAAAAPASAPAASAGKTEAERERIVAAAARLFRRNGFEGTTVRQIADACDMLPGSLHYRYRTKDEILLDMMRLGIEKTIRAGAEATAQVEDPMQKVRVALQAHMRVLMSGDDLVYVLLFEWRALRGQARDEMIAERDRYERYWDAMLQALKDQGAIRQDVDIHLVRLVGLGALNWAATWYRDGGKYTLDEIGSALWDIISRGIAAPERAG